MGCCTPAAQTAFDPPAEVQHVALIEDGERSEKRREHIIYPLFVIASRVGALLRDS